MKLGTVFSGDYLKAADLNDQEHTVVIAKVEVKEFDDGNKLLLTFKDRKKGLVANKTNAGRIAMMHGDETDNWIGKEIILYVDIVDFQGKPTEAIRVRAKKQNVVTSRGKYDLSETKEVPSDDIPF